MKLTARLSAAAILLPWGIAALCAAALAPRTSGQSGFNMNGNMTTSSHAPHAHQPPATNSNTTTTNTNMKANVALAPEPRRPRPATPPELRWSPVVSVPGYHGVWPLKLRAAPSALAATSAEVMVNEGSVEVLELSGEFLRVSVSVDASQDPAQRRVEGWAAWGDVQPETTALVLDARTGAVLERLALGGGVQSVSFSPDGKRALFHGAWTRRVYEADADLSSLRQLAAEGEDNFGPAVYVGPGHELLVHYERLSPGHTSQTLFAVRVGEGGMTAAPFTRSPAGAQPSRTLYAPDGRLGFAFYTFPYGDEAEMSVEEDRGSVVTVEVFDPATSQTVRRFKLPDPALGYDPGSLALNDDGSEFYLLDQQGQRLVVVETQAGALVREVSLAGAGTRTLALAQERVGTAGPLVNFWDADGGGDEHLHGEPGALRVTGGRAVPEEFGASFTVEAGGARYAVDGAGSRLFTLDAERRPVKTYDIPRRENDYQVPVGLFATPDGSRLILLLSAPQDGC